MERALHSHLETEPNTATHGNGGKLMYVRGIARVAPMHRALGTYVRRRRPYFFDVRRTYGKRDRDTNLFTLANARARARARSQLVARPFIFHVARAIDHCSLHPVISGN